MNVIFSSNVPPLYPLPPHLRSLSSDRPTNPIHPSRTHSICLSDSLGKTTKTNSQSVALVKNTISGQRAHSGLESPVNSPQHFNSPILLWLPPLESLPKSEVTNLCNILFRSRMDSQNWLDINKTLRLS